MRRCFLIMAGGTGGHVFPALAVADELRARGHAVHWLGSRGGFEESVVPAAGIPLTLMGVAGLRGKGWSTWLQAPWRLSVSLLQAIVAMLRVRPDAVLGMGGFAAGPGGLVAWGLRRPLVIHEQNAVAGLTNRLLSRLARCVLLAFDGALTGPRTRVVGNPVRRDLLTLGGPEARLARHAGAVRVLVIGGSRGARALNETLPRVLARVTAEGCEVLHQAGRGQTEAVRAAYASHGLQAEVREFIDDMAAAYDWADLVVCRAGALTVSEIMAVGIAAVFVPYPHAVDDHQFHNAEPLVAVGAARRVVEDARFAEALETCIAGLLVGEDPGVVRRRLSDMAVRARDLARPRAVDEVADVCEEVAVDG